MIIRSNVHTHTDFCDGSDSMEDMVRAAIACGMDTLGISFHSFTPFDTSYCIRDYPAYMRELSRLRKKYAGSICLLGGVELDLYGQRPRECDYVIGSVHYLKQGGNYYPIDFSRESFCTAVREVFGGDFYAAAERYYEEVAGLATSIVPDIYGHFDLITRFNLGGALFDEGSERYMRAALAAADSLPRGAVVEVNLGRLFKGEGGPYPSDRLICGLAARGCRFMLSSDAHCAGALGYDFDGQCQRLKGLGISSLVRYKGRRLCEVAL